MLFPQASLPFVSTDYNLEYKAAINNVVTNKHPSVKNLATIDGKKVRVVVYTANNNYKVGTQKLNQNIFVTIAPELKTHCQKYVAKNQKNLSAKKLNLWIAKLLGLPEAGAYKRKLVEIEVPVVQAFYGKSAGTEGIFRPCADPRIYLHNDGSEICPVSIDFLDDNIPKEYREWFAANNKGLTKNNVKYPFTGKGYTYNWNKDAGSPIGLSEFVVLQNTLVNFIANSSDKKSPYISPIEYCT